jgi:hypothetical protein
MQHPKDFLASRGHVETLIPLWGVYVIEALGELMSDQDTLNQFVADLSTAIQAVSQEIQALQQQPAAQPLDWSGANAALSSLQSLEAPAPEPPPNQGA